MAENVRRDSALAGVPGHGAGAVVGVTRAGAAAASRFWMPLLAGAACWVTVFLLLPKPMWIYVLGHESTHAVWTWIFGGKVKRFKAASSGGHVVTTKNNFVITLAPYFFPFYAVLVVLVFVVGDLLWHWRGRICPGSICCWGRPTPFTSR
jgi:hypothetical protein